MCKGESILKGARLNTSDFFTFSHLYWKLCLSTIPYYLWSSFISWLKGFGSPVLKFPFESAAM